MSGLSAFFGSKNLADEIWNEKSLIRKKTLPVQKRHVETHMNS